jgi:glycosyltransferase involved in cell wall biosynthesis
MRSVTDLSVVVPVRNGERLIEGCLESIVSANPGEIIVVDGVSTDRTLEIACRYPVRIVSDGGRGLPAARHIGVKAARGRWVALIDADVVFPEGALQMLFEEFLDGGYEGLQAGLRSVSGSGYWGRALVRHHRSGRSRHWFGVAATILERRALLVNGFDERFRSGEDIDLRWRLRRQGAKLGVSRDTVVEHRFGDTFDFAKGQWLADGHGLGRMVSAYGPRAAALLGLPLAACTRGVLLSVVTLQPQWIPYYGCYLAYNYVGLLRELRPRLRRARPALVDGVG